MKVLGHRGIPVLHPENTIKSFLTALRYGADGWETDVRLTADGVPVLIHDEDLERLAGKSLKVSSLRLSELKEFSINGEKVPTLEEFLRVIPPGKWVNLELKEAEAGELAVKFALSHYDGHLVFSSFDHELIDRLKWKYEQANFGYLFDERHKNLSFNDIRKLFAQRTFSAHLPVELKLIAPRKFFAVCNLVKSLNLKLVLWTVNEPSLIEDIREFLDFVITDDVRLFT